MYGIDELRRAVKLFANMNETFNQKFSHQELMMLARMCWASDWDILPDQWTEEQVDLALMGKVPCWEYKEDGTIIPIIHN